MKAIKRAIILCWALLIVCFIIKLIGGNWFEIICNNEHFISVCKYIDEHIVLNSIIGLSLYLLAGYFIFKAISNTPGTNMSQRVYILIVLTAVWSLNFWNIAIKSIAEIFVFVISPYVVNKLSNSTLKNVWYRGIIGYALIFAFQFVSLITKNIGIKIIDESFLVTTMFSIDYYIMVTLYYLYVKIKER